MRNYVWGGKDTNLVNEIMHTRNEDEPFPPSIPFGRGA